MILKFSKYLIIALLVLSISCTGKEYKVFSFVQICDTQLGFGSEGYESDIENLQQAVVQINELDPDFVVICGDLVHTPNDRSFSDFKNTIKDFNMPCFNAPGNHDIGNSPNDTTLSYYRKTIGKDYYKFHHKGYSFIVSNTQLWKVNVDNESEKHDQWFKKTLDQKNIKNPAIVIGHHPLYTVTPEEKDGYFTLPLIKRQELLNLFLQNKVVAYLSGHTHKVVINDYNNILLVSSETTSKNFDKRPYGYRLWQISSDSIKHHFVPLQASVNE